VFYLANIGNSLALNNLRRGIELLEKVGHGEYAICTLDDGCEGIGLVEIGLENGSVST
jgi:hypothetical protein